MESLQKAWNLFKLAEAGELPAESATEAAAETSSSPAPTSHTIPPATLDDSEATPYAQRTVTLSKAALKRAARETREQEQYNAMTAAASLRPDLGKREQDELATRLAPIVFDAPYKGTKGAKVHDIAADGHCLFRSLAHQLSLYLPFEAPSEKASCSCPHAPDYVALREACRQEILSNPDDYAPFLLDDEGDLLTPEGIRDYAEKIAYCGSSPVWGSHLEVSIVSKLFQRPITIIGADFDMTVGDGLPERSKSKLFISFHKHLYSSEHYNSLVPVSFGADQ